MSILIIQLPARARLSGDAEAADVGASSFGAAEYSFVLTDDGINAVRQGRATPAMLPRADSVIAVMSPLDVSWHRLTLPKAPQARLRAALAGLLEESLLDDPDNLHFAVAPEAKVGQMAWVATCDHTWLTAQLMALEKARVRIDRVVPGVAPDDPPAAYFHEPGEGGPAAGDPSAQVLLTWSSPDGVSTWPLTGTLSRHLLPDPLPVQARFYATPPVASQSERWLGRAVMVQTPQAFMLAAGRSLWNLLQFELTPRSKGLQVLSDRWRQFLGPQWRPVRVGLVALVLVQLVGLNLWAWQQKSQIKARRAQMVQVLKEAHPQVQVVVDAPAQMQRATETLRAQAGQPGGNDLEALMAALARAWPPEKPTAQLQYDGSSLTVALPAGWRADEMAQLRTRLSAQGLAVSSESDALVTVRRAVHP